MKNVQLILLLSALFLSGDLLAAPLGTAFTYQGRLTDGTNALNGSYDMTFALFDSPVSSNRLGFVEELEVSVENGLFLMYLDFGPNAFNGQSRWLEISVRPDQDGAGTYTRLVPRQQIFPAPYALMSADVPDGIITSNKLAVGAVGTSNIAPRAVTSAALSRFITLGAPDFAGRLDIYSDNAPLAIRLEGDPPIISLYGSDGLEKFRASTPINGGEIQLFDRFTNDMTVRLNSGAGSSFDTGGSLELFSSSDALSPSRRRVNLNSGSSGGQLELYNRAGNRTFWADAGFGDMLVGDTSGVTLSAGFSLGGVGYLSMRGLDGVERIQARASSFGELHLRDQSGIFSVNLSATTNIGGFLQLLNSKALPSISATGGLGGGVLTLNSSNGTQRARLFGANGGGELDLQGSDGLEKVRLSADSNLGSMILNNNFGFQGVTCAANFFNGGGFLVLHNTNGQSRAVLDGGSSGGKMSLYNVTGALSVDVRSQFNAGNNAAWVGLNDNGSERISFAARNGSTGAGGLIGVKNGVAGNTILITGDTGGGNSKIGLFNASSVEVIQLHASHPSNSKGRIVTPVLEITAGADVSEQFDVAAPDGSVQAGMVVCIDPANPGKLVMSTKAYDRTVAGIISGAGGVSPGMLMGQQGTRADGKHPVALTGRVYCMANAEGQAIHPGDLLTTSSTAGHAMKASDAGQAQGAVLGKAMTGLESGKGLVLVLVSLQ